MTASFNLSQLANKVNTSGQLDASTGLYNQVPQANGGTGATSLASVAVTSVTAGTGISVSASTGAVTITNTGGSGGATETTSATNITLTNTSNRAQVASFTADDKGFVLPNATTMTTLGYPIFALSNKGYYGSSIFASDGGKLGSVAVGETASLGLSNNSNASTGWFGADAMNLKVYATTNFTIPASFVPNGFNANGLNNWDISPLSSTSFIVTWANDLEDIYAVVGTVSGTTITFGTPVLVYATTTYTRVKVVGLSSTNALVTCHSSNGQTFGLTISGSTITTVSPSVTLTTVSMPSITKIDSTRAIIGYTSSSTNACRIITFNGASAPTQGSAVTLIGASYTDSTETLNCFALIDTDKVVAFYSDSDSTPTIFGDFARVCSISGTTITLGGQTTLSTSTTAGGYTRNKQAIPISTTEAVCTNGYAVSVSGTTVTSLITAGENFNSNYDNTANPQRYAYLGSDILVDSVQSYATKYKYVSPFIQSNGRNIYNATPNFTKTIALDSTTAIGIGGGYTGGTVDVKTTFGACVIKLNT